ncbi:DUF3597 domain-containing protein [Paraburkholderia sp.]|uniref:DUF3597 domain-containing protein n=1 Tax=Paraburkholderia sp. TaxID=1926495 RepID=UPI0026236990|nr:DUF3597 domain-containing protein [Paraburkholderia sp.]
MSLFANLMGKIFGHATTVAAAAITPAPSGSKPGTGPIDAPTPAVASSAPAPASAPVAAAPAQVDVGAILDGLAAKNSEKLDWKHSIVDLMKLVGEDSSLSARKQLAAELKYTGDTNDSATMNVWLHTQVMHALAANGGKLPSDLAG